MIARIKHKVILPIVLACHSTHTCIGSLDSVTTKGLILYIFVAIKDLLT